MPLPGPPGKSGYTTRSSRDRAGEAFSLRLAGGGVLRAVLLAAALTLLASTVVYFTDLDERILQWAVNAGSFVVLGAASFVTARRAGRHGLLYGTAIGVFYSAVTLVLGLLLFPPFMGLTAFLKRLGFSVLAGACGGVLGVNS